MPVIKQFGTLVFEPLYARKEKVHFPECEQHQNGIYHARAEHVGDEVVRGPVYAEHTEYLPYGKHDEIARREDYAEIFEHLAHKEPYFAVKELYGPPLYLLPQSELAVVLSRFGEVLLAYAYAHRPAEQPVYYADGKVYQNGGNDARKILRPAADADGRYYVLHEGERAQPRQYIVDKAQYYRRHDDISRGI